MRMSLKLDTPHVSKNIAARFDKIWIYLSVLGFLSMVGIYLLLM